jgi:hypothetical protein
MTRRVKAETGSSVAGDFAENRFRDRRRVWLRRIWWIFPALAAFEVAVPVGVGLWLQPQHPAFYWGFGAGLAVATVMILADSPPHHIERWRQGAQGEKATAKALRALERSGWVVLNDIDIGKGNIDHLVVGPPGVFVLETKSLHGLLSVERGVLAVRWREDPSDGYENHRLGPRMTYLARAVGQRLRVDDLGDVCVQPVVVLWGHFEQRSILSGGVAWVRGKHLADTLAQRPDGTATDRDRVVAALRDAW